ncbi:MAG: hypothetical protein GX957_04165 [Clostridiaceae bacterium]|nr:hypothetical protein [Clostridiaceae bacterium]
MHKIEINDVKKVIIATVSGFVTVDGAKNYISDLEKTIKKINASEYAFIIDGTEQKTVGQDVVPYLKKAIDIYIETPFRKKMYIELKSAVASSQIKRVGANPLAQHMIAVESLEKALELA